MFRPQQYVETSRAFGPYLPPLPLQGFGAGIFSDSTGMGSIGSSKGLGADSSCGAEQAAFNQALQTLNQITTDLNQIQNRAANMPDDPFQQAAAGAAQQAFNVAQQARVDAESKLVACQNANKQQEQQKSQICSQLQSQFISLRDVANGEVFGKIAAGDSAALKSWQENILPTMTSISTQAQAGGCPGDFSIPTAPPLGKQSGPVVPPKPPTPCITGQQVTADGKGCEPVPVPVAPSKTNWLLIAGVAAAAAVGILLFTKKKARR